MAGLKRMEESSTELLPVGNIRAEYMLAQYDLGGISRMGILSDVSKSWLYIWYSRRLMKYLTSAIVFYVILGSATSRVCRFPHQVPCIHTLHS